MMGGLIRPSRPFALTASGLAVFLGALDTYVIVSVLLDIMRDMNVAVNSIQEISPAITGYLWGYTIAMPLLGQCSDHFGRKIVIQLNLLLFMIGSVLTALASSVMVLVGARAVQGLAAGALLPVTMALVSDLWADRKRTVVLGFIGGAQEFGALVGPMYGVWVAAACHTWRAIFWLNIPIIAGAMLIIHWGVPWVKSQGRLRVDYEGAALLALALSMFIFGLYNPHPETTFLSPHAGAYLSLALIAVIAFIVWEVKAPVRLLDTKSLIKVPFIASLAVSLCVGAAMMVTLVDIELFAQGLCGLSQKKSVGLLSHFLVAVPIGGVVGGFIAEKWGEKYTAIVGMLLAGSGFWKIAQWKSTVIQEQYSLAGISIGRSAGDLFIVGCGLGLVLAPIASSMLLSVTSQYHGLTSALVVVARTLGMLIGIASLTAWGIYSFHHAIDKFQAAAGVTDFDTLAAFIQHEKIINRLAFAQEYHEIFGITAVICATGAVCATGLPGKKKVKVNEITAYV